MTRENFVSPGDENDLELDLGDATMVGSLEGSFEGSFEGTVAGTIMVPDEAAAPPPVERPPLPAERPPSLPPRSRVATGTPAPRHEAPGRAPAPRHEAPGRAPAPRRAPMVPPAQPRPATVRPAPSRPATGIHAPASAAVTPAPASAAGASASGVSATPGAAGEGVALPEAGTRVRHYELIRELGRGGMGTVFLARDIKLGRRVAIKFLQGSGNRELTDRFVLEARATAQCSHENIVIIHEVDEHKGNPFMVLEYMQGVPLTKHLVEGHRMATSRAVELIVPVVRALECAHAQEIVHRDLKPDNIFVTDTGTVKVLDFGIAKLVQQQQQQPRRRRQPGGGTQDGWPTGDGNTELTQLGALVGTMPYMSPEQWMGEGVDLRTDIWAVGIILFKMVVGHHPLAPLRGQQLMVTAMLDQPMPRVAMFCPDVPPELADVIDRCLVKPKEQRMSSASALLEALEPLMPGRFGRRLVSSDRSPYAGLSAFQEADADRFFGRAQEISALATRLRDQPLIGVVGPSGVGKSSFVRAGLVPALKQSGEPWETLVVRPGRNPMAALANVVAPMIRASSSSPASSSGVSGASPASSPGSSPGTGPSYNTTSMTSASLADDISAQEVVLKRLQVEPGFLGTVLRSRARRHGRRILLFVDQFEELYTLIPDIEERMAFTTCLAGVADDATTPLRIVLSIRSDFLDRVAEDQRFMSELTQGLFFLLPPSRDGLRDAIVQPAEMAGYHFEVPRMVDHMLDTLESTSGALPLLQFAASKLWDARDTQRRLLSEQSYLDIGGIQGALASHADAVMAELSPQAQTLLRSVFLRLVTPERTRAIASVAELRELSRDPGEVQRLVDHLVQARLLVVQTGAAADGPSVEIVHESLVHSWPLLRRWLDENQDDAAFLEQLRTAAKQWQARNRPHGLLWRGDAMEEARRWHRRFRGELPALQQEYLSAVFNLGARATRVRRFLVAAGMVLLTGIAGVATVGYVTVNDAEKVATAQAAAAQDAEQRMREQFVKLQQSMEAQKLAEKQAREALLEAQAANDEVAQREAELADTNDDLLSALEKATKAKRRARRASKRALRGEEQALRAEGEARNANERLGDMLEREQDRVKRLERQLGGTIFEDLN